AAVIGAAAVVGYAFLVSFAAVRPYAQTDPRVQAAIWLRHHVPRGTTIATASTYYLTVPQLETAGYHDEEVGRHDVARLAGASSRYLVLSDINLLPWQEAIGHYPDVRRFISYVQARYCVQAQFENSQRLLWIDGKNRRGKVPFDWLDAN